MAPGVLNSPKRSRKALGAWYTPEAIVRGLLDLALQPAIDLAIRSDNPVGALMSLRVLDPSCGDGAFLVPAAQRLIDAARRVSAADCAREIVERCIVGVDIDSSAAVRCAKRLCEIAPGASARIVVADALRAGPSLFGDERFEVVVGNPPFLNQLERTTANARDLALRVREWSGGVVKGYADASGAFLLLSASLLAEGGRCALVLPRSILSTRDAAPILEHVRERCAIESMWFDDGQMFDASVRVCAPVIRPGSGSRAVRRFVSASFVEIAPCAHDLNDSWRGLLPELAAIPSIGPFERTLGDVASATADFRDQYYGLEGRIVEDAEARARCPDVEVERGFPRLVTSGLIDRDECLWGKRSTRIHKRSWRAPRLDRERVERETSLGPWLRARLVPKILLATQTRTLEPILDERGELLPCVPVITIVPKPCDPRPVDTLRLVHRSLLAPESTAFAAREFAGAALSPDAIKLAAKQVMALPYVERPSVNRDEIDAWFARRLAK